jgi:hypothetical protein
MDCSTRTKTPEARLARARGSVELGRKLILRGKIEAGTLALVYWISLLYRKKRLVYGEIALPVE